MGETKNAIKGARDKLKMRLRSGKKRGETVEAYRIDVKKAFRKNITLRASHVSLFCPSFPGADPTFFPGKILISSTYRASQDNFEESAERTDTVTSEKTRLRRTEIARHWRTEFNYTAGMTDTLMGGRGNSSNFGNTFPAFLFHRPLDRNAPFFDSLTCNDEIVRSEWNSARNKCLTRTQKHEN